MSRVNQIEADKPRKAALLPLFFPCPRATDARGQGKTEGGGWLCCLNLIHPRGKLVGVALSVRADLLAPLPGCVRGRTAIRGCRLARLASTPGYMLASLRDCLARGMTLEASQHVAGG